jgi:hypothetical protein
MSVTGSWCQFYPEVARLIFFLVTEVCGRINKADAVVIGSEGLGNATASLFTTSTRSVLRPRPERQSW